jgi:hypothetical protein
MSADGNRAETKTQVPLGVDFLGRNGDRSAMARTVARLNIEHFRRKLAEETDETKLRMLQRLLAERKQRQRG